MTKLKGIERERGRDSERNRNGEGRRGKKEKAVRDSPLSLLILNLKRR